MKNIFRISGVILLTLIIQSCKKEEIPNLTTISVTNITETSAHSGGNVTDDGKALVISRGLVWSKNQQPTLENNNGFAECGTGLGLFTYEMTGLIGNTTYYVRSFASNKAGTSYGNQQDFKTLLVEKPSVTTKAAKDVTTTTAIIGGDVSVDGGSPVTERGIYWSTSQSPETTGTKVQVGTGNGDFFYQLTSLSINTVYFIKAYAKNIKGEALGEQVSFTTLPLFPIVSTTEPLVVATFFSIVGGNATYDGGGTISERGIYWGKSPSPELTGTKVISGTGLGTFTAQLSNLAENTTYYIKAFAKNAGGIGYGDQLTLLTNSTIKDIDNNAYGFVQIGNQWWFTENLKTTKYSNGESIGTTTPANKDITNETNPKYQWAYDSTESIASIYGRLYTGYVLIDSRGICPTGWHVPSDNDWSALITYLGGESIAAGKLKETGLSHWNSPNTNATNEYGFTALPGGGRDYTGRFGSLGDYANWYTSTINSYKMYELKWNSGAFVISGTTRQYGFSVRCVRD